MNTHNTQHIPTSPPEGPPATTLAPAPAPARAAATKRRGTIIVLALGVLAILAIAAVSYVAIVRIDRGSVAASSRRFPVQPQVNTVTNELGALIAADLFGNKIVTRDTPAKVWPSAFEDGDYTDIPSVDAAWAQTNLNVFNQIGAGVTLNNPDDAWLASTEPVIDQANFLNSYWPQISNIRSGWRYLPRSGSQAEQWKRDDGQFLDLQRWFLSVNASGNANPAADLSANNTYTPRLGTAYTFPAGAASPDATGLNATRVFGTQMNRVENAFSAITAVSNDQERFWVDTDGDLRPDARWQRLDALGNAYGLSWVVAARIIDASALVNFNTATTFPYRSLLGGALLNGRTWADVVGTGETPADVDLLRLVGYSAPPALTTLAGTFTRELPASPAIWPAGINTDRLLDASTDPAFRVMLASSMGFGTTMRSMSMPPLLPTDPAYNPPYAPRLNNSANHYPEQTYPPGFESSTSGWAAMDFPTAAQRAVWYDLLTGDADHPAPRSVQPLTTRDFADLHAFRGTNNTTVTGKLEQYLDGTESNGYQPGSANNSPYGPLRSREGTDGNNATVAESPRVFGDPDQDAGSTAGRPTLRQLQWDNRHLLTPVSGVGRIGPVPVLNTEAYTGTTPPAQKSYFDGQRSLPRINLPELETTLAARGRPDRDTAQRVFDAFVWALAPLATDQPFTRDLAVGNLYAPRTAPSGGSADSQIRHYGGTTNGPAAKVVTDASLPAGNAFSAFAVLKALSLTVNLMDALDSTAVDGTLTNESPTTLRLYNENTQDLSVIAATSAVPALGTRLAQGNIPPASLPANIFGNSNLGVTAIGLDRQPFLVQASYYAFYEDSDALPNGVDSPNIEAGQAKEHLGSIIAFELRNPWPQDVDLSNYKIMVRNTAATDAPTLEFDLDVLTSGAARITPGGSVVAFYAAGNTTGNEMQTFWGGTGPANGFVEQFKTLCATNGAAVPLQVNIAGVRASTDSMPSIDPATLPPVFADFLLGGAGPVKTIPVLLVRRAGAGVFSDTVVDRLSPPASGAENFPNILVSDYTFMFPSILVGPTTVQQEGRARVCIPSTIYRATERQSAKGFPSYVVERRESNKAQILSLAPAEYTAPGGTVARRQTWVTGPTALGIAPDPEPTAIDFVNSAEGALGPGSDPSWQNIGAENKGNLTIAGTPYTGTISLFNPVKHRSITPPDPLLPPPVPAISSAADVLLIPTVATLYVHAIAGEPNAREAADLARSFNASGVVAFGTQIGSGNGAWITASEQLGSDWELFRDPALGTTIVNPYAGILDPSQYILSNQLTPADAAKLPDSLSIPLALRVVDAFDGLTFRGELAQGKVNLNTAPPRVLACLPFLSPLTAIDNADDQDGTTAQVSMPAPATNDPQRYPLLYEWLLPYRSLRLEGNPSSAFDINTASSRATKTNLPGLRNRNNHPARFGLTSVGELGAMSTWNPAQDGNVSAGPIDTTGFLHIGANALEERGVPFGRLGAPASHVLDTAPTDFRVSDGPEERAALLRALANIATTRSDVFIATFVLRGYDPDIIESINVNGSGNPPSAVEARNAMNNEKFRPTVDTRWLVVYDRSNVKLPTDRPKVLLQMELPGAKP